MTKLESVQTNSIPFRIAYRFCRGLLLLLYLHLLLHPWCGHLRSAHIRDGQRLRLNLLNVLLGLGLLLLLLLLR